MIENAGLYWHLSISFGYFFSTFVFVLNVFVRKTPKHVVRRQL